MGEERQTHTEQSCCFRNQGEQDNSPPWNDCLWEVTHSWSATKTETTLHPLARQTPWSALKGLTDFTHFQPLPAACKISVLSCPPDEENIRLNTRPWAAWRNFENEPCFEQKFGLETSWIFFLPKLSQHRPWPSEGTAPLEMCHNIPAVGMQSGSDRMNLHSNARVWLLKDSCLQRKWKRQSPFVGFI